MSRVLIGITTQNRASILPQAIRSACAQQFPGCRVAVIDDASTDSTPEFAADFPSVSWRRHERPCGYRENRNLLMRETDADYYVSLDDDAWFLIGDEIGQAVAVMDSDPSVGAVAFDILSPDRPNPVPRTAPEIARMFIGCGHMLRLSAVRAAGFYAPTPGEYGTEEKDLCYRLADLGFVVVKLPGVHVWHDKAWTGRDWYPLHRSGVCNELAMTVRRCPLPDLALVLPLKLASFLRFWIRRPTYLRAGFAGVLTFIRHLPRTWRTRQPVRRRTFWAFSRSR